MIGVRYCIAAGKIPVVYKHRRFLDRMGFYFSQSLLRKLEEKFGLPKMFLSFPKRLPYDNSASVIKCYKCFGKKEYLEKRGGKISLVKCECVDTLENIYGGLSIVNNSNFFIYFS